MEHLLIMRLHPVDPIKGTDFNEYLKGLQIKVSDRRFVDPSGRVGVIGTATYDPNPNNSTIIQHLQHLGVFLSPMPAATAVVQIKLPPAPSPYPEYPENNLPNDLVLTITRSGKTIVDHSINYNVGILKWAGPPPLPPPDEYVELKPVALYLPLPDPHLGLDPNLAYLDVPADGTPPNFKDLTDAVNKVLAKDPGGSFDLTALTPDQCRHIAYEIVWNRNIDPLPVPPGGLTVDELYDSSANKDKERKQFEADLTTYYTIHNTRADTLAKFVYAMSAAFACNKKSQEADHVGFRFPILPGLSVTSEKVAEATVVISQ